MIVVSDSSPLIALARIGRLSLLASLYQRILIPSEVHHEVTVAGRDLPGGREVGNAGWIEVMTRRSSVDTSLEQACLGLGAGERGAIVLAKGLPADLILLMNGGHAASRRRRVFLLSAVWECWKQAPGRASLQICARPM